MKRHPPVIAIPAGDRKTLVDNVASRNCPKKVAQRSEIVLLAGAGRRLADIARTLRVSRHTVRIWRDRYISEGMAGIEDKPGRGRKPSVPPEVIGRILTEATQPVPPRTRWSCRTMARHVGVGKSKVQAVWSKNDIKPHRVDTFKISKDPRFEEKFWDVIGLYLDPPEKAIVLCCDEKTQCQAIERTQPGLPLGQGHLKTKTHDYYRHGTVTLFAALNYLDGKLHNRIDTVHTHKEWLAFLRQIDRETPKDMELHLIVDNYCTHKEQNVLGWLAKHKRFHMHYTPTSSSWMNLVERFFRDISQEVIREGSFTSAKELADAILSYMAQRNDNPKRYVWRADGQEILRKIQRARSKLAQITNNV